MLKSVVRRPSKRRVRDDDWRLPDALWAKMKRLLPARPEHPLECHNPRVPDRAAMDAILFVLRTGCQWNALRETTICSSSSAHELAAGRLPDAATLKSRLAPRQRDLPADVPVALTALAQFDVLLEAQA